MKGSSASRLFGPWLLDAQPALAHMLTMHATTEKRVGHLGSALCRHCRALCCSKWQGHAWNVRCSASCLTEPSAGWQGWRSIALPCHAPPGCVPAIMTAWTVPPRSLAALMLDGGTQGPKLWRGTICMHRKIWATTLTTPALQLSTAGCDGHTYAKEPQLSPGETVSGICVTHMDGRVAPATGTQIICVWYLCPRWSGTCARVFMDACKSLTQIKLLKLRRIYFIYLIEYILLSV